MKKDANADGRNARLIARERLLVEELSRLEGDLAELTDISDRMYELERNHRVLRERLRQHETRIDRLRLDKQLLGFPRWVKQRFTRTVPTKPALPAHETAPGLPVGGKTLLLIAPKYPTEEIPYGGQPVERRTRYYREAGYNVVVLVPSSSASLEQADNGVVVVRDSLNRLPELAGAMQAVQICIHHPLPDYWTVVKPLVDEYPTHAWIHGFEARDWRDSLYNFTESQVVERAEALDTDTEIRRAALSDLFADERVTKIFVSQYMRELAESFTRRPSVNARVIHNVIDPDLFPYQSKSADDRFRIVSVRSYASRKYATDLLTQVVEGLADKEVFDRLTFEIWGDGEHFDEDTEPLEKYQNVNAHRGILDGAEVASLMERGGLLLLPTRWDSQGMTMGEAMSSGVVPVTNAVSGIPEFVDDSVAILAEGDDTEALVQGIEELAADPTRYVEMSEAAVRRVGAQCGPGSTVEQEMAMFEASMAASRLDIR